MLQTQNLLNGSIRIIQTVTGVEAPIANEVLTRSGGSAKIAIVMLAKGINRSNAITLLEKHQGFLRPILAEDETNG